MMSDDVSGVSQVDKPFQVQALVVQALVAHLAVEGLDDAVLSRLSRLDEVQLDLVLVGALIEGAPSELRPVIDLDHARFAACFEQPLQHPNHAMTARGVHRSNGYLPRPDGYPPRPPEPRGGSSPRKQSTTLRVRKRRPPLSVSCMKSMKSILHVWFKAVPVSVVRRAMTCHCRFISWRVLLPNHDAWERQ